MEFFQKKFDLHTLLQQVNRWRLKNERIVFTNGCFDILHPGHVHYLHHAKALGNRLVVGVNTDHSVKRLGKSPNRPYNDELARLSVLAALSSVDALILFDDDTPLELIKSIQPDVLVKGGDYDAQCSDPANKKYIVGSSEVRALGGKVEAIEFLTGFSTTSLVKLIQNDHE
ncbi:MAG TPA: adenylyltransferase/cytidyltransferase family protein [Luteibaculaceae bacterium]|jgi:D-glycero-beta-D-manno-heptose 1-phosphate adenylyltransferase|nr:adenylyltransferase/cytidyltransferase family protein [Luteibaculaceae bacterium]